MKKTLVSVMLVLCCLFSIVGCGGDTSEPVDTSIPPSSSNVQADEQTVPPDSSITSEPSNLPEEPNSNQSSDISQKMVGLGFTEDEAESIRDIFMTVGITEIGSIKSGPGDGIDNLQSFVAPVFNSNQLQVNFAIENRTLCFIELAGIPASQYEAYVSMFGKLKVRKVDTSIAVTLYDIWDENGEIAEGEAGYMAVYNHDEQIISKSTRAS